MVAGIVAAAWACALANNDAYTLASAHFVRKHIGFRVHVRDSVRVCICVCIRTCSDLTSIPTLYAKLVAVDEAVKHVRAIGINVGQATAAHAAARGVGSTFIGVMHDDRCAALRKQTRHECIALRDVRRE